MSKKIMLQSAPRAVWTTGYNGIQDFGPGTAFCRAHDPEDSVSAGDIFVDSTSGSDSNPGTQAQPVASLRKAIELADAAGVNVYAQPRKYAEAVYCPAGVTVYAAPGAIFEYDHNPYNQRTVSTPFNRIYRMITVDNWIYAITDHATSVLQRTQDLSTWESVGTYSDTSAQIYGYMDLTGRHVIVIAQGLQIFGHGPDKVLQWSHHLTGIAGEVRSFCFHSGTLFAAGAGNSSTGETANVWRLDMQTGWQRYIGNNDADNYPVVSLIHSYSGALLVCGTIHDSRYYDAQPDNGVHLIRQYTTDTDPVSQKLLPGFDYYTCIKTINDQAYLFFYSSGDAGFVVIDRNYGYSKYHIDQAEGSYFTNVTVINGSLWVDDEGSGLALQLYKFKNWYLLGDSDEASITCILNGVIVQAQTSASINPLKIRYHRPVNGPGTWHGWQISGGSSDATLSKCDLSGDVTGGMLDYSRQTGGDVTGCQLEGAEVYRSGNISGCNIYESIITRSGSVTGCTAADSVITDNQLDADSQSTMTNCVLRQTESGATLTNCIDAPPLFRDPDADDYRPQMQSAGYRYNSPMIQAAMQPSALTSKCVTVLTRIRGPYKYSHSSWYSAADWQYIVSTDPDKEDKSLAPVQLQTQESPTGIIHQYSPGAKKTWKLSWDAKTAGPDWQDQRQYLRWLYLSGKPFIFGHSEDGNNFASLLQFAVIVQTGDDLPANTIRLDPASMANDTTGLLHNGTLLDHTLDGYVITGGYWQRPVRIVKQIGDLLTLDPTAEIFPQEYVDYEGPNSWNVQVIGYMVQIDRRQSFDLQRAFYTQSTEVPESGYQLTLVEADRW